MKKLSKSLSVAAMALVIGSLFVNSAFAATSSTTNNTRPGFGYGDKNHHHTGPPGQSNRPGHGHYFNFFGFFYNFFHHYHFG